MGAKKEKSGPVTGHENGTEALIKLIGLPGLSDYLHFVKTRVVDGVTLESGALVDEWRGANDHFHELEKVEAGLADTITTHALPATLRQKRRMLRANRYFRTSFDDLPTTIEMVELRHLVVSQESVGTEFSDSIAKRLGRAPSPEALFDFCLPLDRPLPPMQVQRLGDDRYLFVSNSTDFRTHSVSLVTGAAVPKLKTFGPAGAALILPIGFGSNFLSAVKSEKRIVLQNGYHRAFALMSLGISHAPMVIQHVTRTDELRLAASSDVYDNPAFYFRAARPPMLKDFLDPALAKPFRIWPLETRVEVEIKIVNATSPARRRC
jgi:hypothetical protein